MKKKNSLVIPCILSALLFTAATPVFSLNIKAEGQSSNVIEVNSGEEKAISKALESAQSGDTIIIHAGKYEDQIRITTSNLTIKAEEGAVLTGEGMDIEDKSQEISDKMVSIEADDVSISGLEITGLTHSNKKSGIVPKGIYVAPGSDNVSIVNCTVHDMGIGKYDSKFNKDTDRYNAHGILAEATPDNPINNLKIKKCTLYNLKVGNSETLVVNGNVDNFEISGNYIYNCDNIGIDAIGFEQTKKEDPAETVELDRARNGRIYENIVKNISSKGNVTYEGDTCAAGIYVDGGRSIRVFDNFVSNCDIGIEVATEHKDRTVTGIIVTNNTLIKNDALAGIVIGGSDIDENGFAESCVFMNNTVYNTENSCVAIQLAKDPDNVIKNNLFIADREAEIYYEDEESYGKLDGELTNSIVDNMFNQDISEDYPKVMKENKTFKFKNISVPSKDTKDTNVVVTVKSPEAIKGYGSTGTQIK